MIDEVLEFAFGACCSCMVMALHLTCWIRGQGRRVYIMNHSIVVYIPFVSGVEKIGMMVWILLEISR